MGLVLTVTALINLLLSDDFCCEDGLLYVVCLSVPTAVIMTNASQVDCPRAGDGRGMVHGRVSG